MTYRPIRRGRQTLPATVRSAGERREYLIAGGLVAGLRLAVAGALLVSALQSYRLSRQGLPYLSGEIGRTAPMLLALGALIALLAGFQSLRRLRAVQRIPVDPGHPE